MNSRIERFAALAKKEDLNPEPVCIELDEFDDKLAEPLAVAKRLCDFICAQRIKLYEENELIGMMRMNGCPVPADIFTRTGHVKCQEALRRYYNHPQENLCTMEWQHSNADFGKLIRLGLNGYLREINAARRNFLGKPYNLAYLAALEW